MYIFLVMPHFINFSVFVSRFLCHVHISTPDRGRPDGSRSNMYTRPSFPFRSESIFSPICLVCAHIAVMGIQMKLVNKKSTLFIRTLLNKRECSDYYCVSTMHAKCRLFYTDKTSGCSVIETFFCLLLIWDV